MGEGKRLSAWELAEIKADHRLLHLAAADRVVEHISDLEKALENARKDRDEHEAMGNKHIAELRARQRDLDEARKDRELHAQSAEVWRKRVESAAEALADVLPGEVGRLDLLARIAELKRLRDGYGRDLKEHIRTGVEVAEILDGGRGFLGEGIVAGSRRVVAERDEWRRRAESLLKQAEGFEAELASLKPSGQAAEDVARLTESLSSEMGLRLLPEDKAALARLAAKAQGHEAAVLDRGAAIADGAALLEIARFWETMLADVVKNGAGADLGWMGQSKAAEMLAVIRADHPGAALLEQHRKEVEDLKAAMTKAAAELRHTYGHVALGQNINPDLVARAIRILEEASR